MGYRIDFARQGRTLRAVVSGKASLEHAASIGRDIAEHASRQAAPYLLVDVRGLADRVGMLGTLFGLKAMAAARVAVVDVRDNDSHYALPEEAARRRGRSLRYFHDSGTALRWLGE